MITTQRQENKDALTRALESVGVETGELPPLDVCVVFKVKRIVRDEVLVEVLTVHTQSGAVLASDTVRLSIGDRVTLDGLLYRVKREVVSWR